MAKSYIASEIFFEILANEKKFQDWNANKEEVFTDHSKKAALVGFSEELTEKQKRYFAMYYVQGFSIQKIASLDGINKSTVSRTLSRAKSKLQKVLRYSAPHLLNAGCEKRNRRT